MQTPAPPCPVCGAADPAEPKLKIQHLLFQCASCGLFYSDRVGDPDLSRFYADNREDFFDRPYFDVNADLKSQPEYSNYRQALLRVRRLCPVSAPRLLDVGCGTGTLLEAALEAGFTAEGLEVSSVVSARAARHLKIHLYDGDPARIPPMEPFDVVVLWDVLEHLANPVEALRQFQKALKPGGRFLLRTINEDCLLSKWSLALARCGSLAAARRMHEIHHVVYFDHRTLDLCLRRAGLEILDRWFGEFPVERISRNALVRLALRGAYFLQKITQRTYEQYAIASKRD